MLFIVPFMQHQFETRPFIDSVPNSPDNSILLGLAVDPGPRYMSHRGRMMKSLQEFDQFTLSMKKQTKFEHLQNYNGAKAETWPQEAFKATSDEPFCIYKHNTDVMHLEKTLAGTWRSGSLGSAGTEPKQLKKIHQNWWTKLNMSTQAKEQNQQTTLKTQGFPICILISLTCLAGPMVRFLCWHNQTEVTVEITSCYKMQLAVEPPKLTFHMKLGDRNSRPRLKGVLGTVSKMNVPYAQRVSQLFATSLASVSEFDLNAIFQPFICDSLIVDCCLKGDHVFLVGTDVLQLSCDQNSCKQISWEIMSWKVDHNQWGLSHFCPYRWIWAVSG